MPLFTFRPSEVARRVLKGLGQAFRTQAGDQLPPLVDGLVDGLEDLDQTLGPAEGGWPHIFDLEDTFAPAWLGAALGSPVPAGLDLEQAREYIRTRPHWRRGTPGAIEAVVAALLVGSKRVVLYERDGSPWRLTVRVYVEELAPGVDASAVVAAAASHKPVGIILRVQFVDGSSYAHLADEHGPTYADLSSDFSTYKAATHHLPEEGTTP